MSELQLNEEERARQQALSERPATLEERGNVGGIPVQTHEGEITSNFDEAVEESAGELYVLPGNQITKPTASAFLKEMLGTTETTAARLKVRGTMNFVLEMFVDETQELLEGYGNVEIDGVDYNLRQPFNKMNERTKRIGFLTTRVRNLIDEVAKFDDLSCSVLMPADFASDVVDKIVTERASHVCENMYRGFEIDEETDEHFIRLEEGVLIPVSSIFYPTFRTLYHVSVANDGVADIEVVIEVFVRVRAPSLLRLESDKIESTMLRYARHLNKLAGNAGLEGNVFTVFRSRDLFDESVWNLLSVIRENFMEAELLNKTEFAQNCKDSEAESIVEPVYGQADILINLTRELAVGSGDESEE